MNSWKPVQTSRGFVSNKRVRARKKDRGARELSDGAAQHVRGPNPRSWGLAVTFGLVKTWCQALAHWCQALASDSPGAGLERTASQEEEFAEEDYDPHVLTFFCAAIAVAYADNGFKTLQNVDGVSAHLQVLHIAVFFLICKCCTLQFSS